MKKFNRYVVLSVVHCITTILCLVVSLLYLVQGNIFLTVVYCICVVIQAKSGYTHLSTYKFLLEREIKDKLSDQH